MIVSSQHLLWSLTVLLSLSDSLYVLDTPTVVGIAFAAFVIGALLTGALWFIYSHTGRSFTCRRTARAASLHSWKDKIQRNVRASRCQKCAAITAKHPAADRGQFTITYWLLYCKYILLVSSSSSSLSCFWMFWGLLGGQRIFSVQWLETSWKFPMLGLAAPTGKDTQYVH